MKKSIVYLSVLGGFTLLAAGCAPELARSQYGQEEDQWKTYINSSYQNWEPPPTPPPYSNAQVKGTNTPTSGIAAVPDADTVNLFEAGKSDSSLKTEEIPVPTEFAPNATGEQSYTVQKGDTLWSISKKLYGTGKDWKKIEEANKLTLPNSSSLKAGIVLKIPSNK